MCFTTFAVSRQNPLKQKNAAADHNLFKNSHFYWNLASVRAIIPGVLKDEEYTQPIAQGFAQYPSDAFEFVVGTAEAADLDAKTVKVSLVNGGGERVLSYDHLVLATGTRTAGDDVVPWKASGTHEAIMDTLHRTADRVKAAKHIVVAGAGSTGVEVAGELGFEYRKNKEIVLLSSGTAGVLGGDALASNAEAELRKLDVAVRQDARVESTVALPDGKTEITLTGGDKIVTDLYLPTMGMAPNTEYLPAKVLREDKFVAVDEFYRVKNASNVWAAGDIVWLPRGSYVITDKQVSFPSPCYNSPTTTMYTDMRNKKAAGVAKNIDLVLHDKNPAVVKTIPVDVLMATVGRSRGVGRIGPVKVFSYMVYTIKGKTLGTQTLPGMVSGTSY